jgi:hypothetical protein
MTPNDRRDCPDCSADGLPVSRRQFLHASAALAAGGLPLFATPKAAADPTRTSAAETAVKGLYDSLTEEQRAKICFAWDYIDAKNKRGLLRTFTANNWQITPYPVTGEKSIYTKKQQDIIHDIFKGLINPDWYVKFMKQTIDDNGRDPWGSHQSIAIFGQPGGEKFEFVMTGRHQTIRADGNTEAHVAFGGPIFYGHAAKSGNELASHPGNVFWPQAVAANIVYEMLELPQKEKALVEKSPREQAVAFRGGKMAAAPGLPVKEMSADQQKELQGVLGKLIEPFRAEDRDEAMACVKKQGGLEQCVLSFYKDSDIGEDGVWDNWRLEGPAFVWYFRGKPHVHVWVNVADSPDVKFNG